MAPPIKALVRAIDVPLITSDGVSIVCRWYPLTDGDGPARSYVIGHGFTGSSARPAVRLIAERLMSRGAAVLVPDFRGHGRSGGRSSVGETEIADITACVNWLRTSRPRAPVVLLGFSMGASIVLRHAGLGGDADAVIAVSGPGRWFVRSTTSMRRLNRGLETATGRLVLSTVMRTRVARRWETVPLAPVQVAAGITVPALIVHGTADGYFGLEHPRMLASSIEGCQLWLEDGMGHAERATTPELVDRMDGWVASLPLPAADPGIAMRSSDTMA